MLNSPNKNEDDMYGQELILNLYDCDLQKISSGAEIKKFVVTLCDTVIKMKRYGKALIPHFGHDHPLASGYSLVQLIETSSVTAHFSEHKRSVYLNVFSCAWFDPKKTSAFCKKFFGAKRVESHFMKRE
ncbi:S-adenosylmethionine decarboxylase [Patescibacteria group bacterium]|nr:S-adenosylmethionine decarboxylase [Patescibacteria group bacterium]MBU1472616.1 S-adenosylmethionine decarboxylase [Patescibacteria group bacterium]MBU2459614.1 S-adenosylmethionine decarboxylase [Patescibacteria group bacterium]MBU2544072.1 S-adenosylmethionine decarboxylase [Patescibacteria group bacterium]